MGNCIALAHACIVNRCYWPWHTQHKVLLPENSCITTLTMCLEFSVSIVHLYVVVNIFPSKFGDAKQLREYILIFIGKNRWECTASFLASPKTCRMFYSGTVLDYACDGVCESRQICQHKLLDTNKTIWSNFNGFYPQIKSHWKKGKCTTPFGAIHAHTHKHTQHTLFILWWDR